MPGSSDVYVPDATDEATALGRTTHLAIGAHQDDLEAMAMSAIAACVDSRDAWFTGVVCTDGAGSPRSGPYAGVSNEEMVAIRRREQREAAEIGEYSAVVQLGYSSREIRDDPTGAVSEALADLLARTSPRQVCTHNLADRHPTHVAVALATITALRTLPERQCPDEVYGCEGWRALDWMAEGERIALSSSGYEKLAIELIEVFDSQVSGGKRYDLAAVGRRRANATMAESHEVDTESQVTLAMDLTPLVRDSSLDVTQFTLGAVDRFRDEVAATLDRFEA